MAGLSATACAAILGVFHLGTSPSAFTLAAVALPVAITYSLVNIALTVPYVILHHRVGVRDAMAELSPHLVGVYVPFLFGAFVGELSLRFGLVVFALAAATFVMIQAVFGSWRKLVESEQQTCEGLIAAVERKDPYTAGHSQRVAKFANYMGSRLGFKGANLARLERQALMHDIGKLAVPNHVLRKPGRLDDDERALMLRHEPAGAAILSQVPLLVDSAAVASGADDRRNLQGPVTAAHIVHAADAFDAMTSTRAYRQPHTQEDALAELEAKSGVQFHGDCVVALQHELDARDETYGLGHEEGIVVYDTPPPKAALGKTLHDGEAAPEDDEPKQRTKRHASLTLPRDLSNATILGLLATVAAIAAAVHPAFAPVALGLLIGASELVCLRPVGRPARTLSSVPILVALTALELPAAIGTIAAGIVLGAALRDGSAKHRLDMAWRSVAVTAATVGAYAALEQVWPGTENVVATLGTLLGAAFAAAIVDDALHSNKRQRFARTNRLADLALVTCGPLAALGTAGTASTAGLGMGALVILAVPLVLLAQGFDRNQRARTNLFAWIQAASVAPGFAGLAAPGRAQRVVRYCRAIAGEVGLDDETADQLEAAAWMERVGECCLDESYVSGMPHTAESIVEESAAILKSTKAFYAAGQILWAYTNEPELAGETTIDRAGQILRVAIAFEDVTNGDVDTATVPAIFARLRTNEYHQVDSMLCDVLQQFVAPNSHRSPWTPVRTHALLTCACVTAVDDFAFAGDDITCTQHGAQRVDALALDQVRESFGCADSIRRTTRMLLDGTRRERLRAKELQRELFTHLTGAGEATLGVIARSAYDAGLAWEHTIAECLRDAGFAPDRTAAVLSAAGTSDWDAWEAMRGAYTPEELDDPRAPVTPGPRPTHSTTRRRARWLHLSQHLHA